jgi:hypothetical protein
MPALLLNPLIRFAVVGLIAGVMGFGLAWKLRGATISAMKAAQALAIQAATARAAGDQRRADSVSLDFANRESSDQSKETVKTVTITKWAIRHVKDVASCPTADLVRLHNAAATGTDPEGDLHSPR